MRISAWSSDVCSSGLLDERRVGKLGQAARNLGLAAARGADPQDILGADLIAQVGRQLLAAPAIAQRDGDRALRRGLADYLSVDRGHDRLRGQLFDNARASCTESVCPYVCIQVDAGT